MSTHTLILIGMIELFIIAMAFIATWRSKIEHEYAVRMYAEMDDENRARIANEYAK